MKTTLKVLAVLAILSLAVFVWKSGHKKQDAASVTKEIHATIQDIRVVVSATGGVQPQNRVEIKPNIGGRIEEMRVREGDRVIAGQTLALMSSTERAAILDAARGRGENQVQYWADVYKPIPIIAPLSGEVIVRNTEPGQSVNPSDVILVVSDRLIVKAQVDETDIGRVKAGLKVDVSLDAYPDTVVSGVIQHISYESKLVNNVTMYEVDIILSQIPTFFRSGMSANAAIIINERKGVLAIPLAAVKDSPRGTMVLVMDSSKKVHRRPIKTGIKDEINIEVVAGLSASDTVVIRSANYKRPTAKSGGNPFMRPRPQGGGGGGNGGSRSR